MLLATVAGTPNSDVVLYLVQDGQRVQTLTTEEVSPGTYVANVLVEAKDATREGILVSRLDNQGEIRFATAEMPVRLIAETAKMQQLTAESVGDVPTEDAAPAALSLEALQPEVTNYQNGDRFSGSSILLEGKTLPNATVSVSGSASTSLIGGFLGTQQELSSKTVEADSEGNFSVSLGLPALSQSGTTYTLQLKGMAEGKTSPTTEIELVQK